MLVVQKLCEKPITRKEILALERKFEAAIRYSTMRSLSGPSGANPTLEQDVVNMRRQILDLYMGDLPIMDHYISETRRKATSLRNNWVSPRRTTFVRGSSNVGEDSNHILVVTKMLTSSRIFESKEQHSNTNTQTQVPT